VFGSSGREFYNTGTQRLTSRCQKLVENNGYFLEKQLHNWERSVIHVNSIVAITFSEKIMMHFFRIALAYRTYLRWIQYADRKTDTF
jgi:hypothetical protein